MIIMKIKIDLAKYRTLGDDSADEIIQKLVQQEGIYFLRQLMPFLSDYQNLSFQNQPQILQDFLSNNASFPDFYDKKSSFVLLTSIVKINKISD